MSEAGEGPALLFVHGAPGGHDLGVLLERHYDLSGYRLLCPSRPGYLRTPLAARASVIEQADLLAALLDTLAIERAIVMAHSTGAPIAVHFAVRHASRCLGLVLAAGVFRPLPAARATRFALGFLAPLLQAAEIPSHASIWILRRFGDAVAQLRKNRTVPLDLAALPVLTESLLPASLRAKGLANDLRNLASLERLPFRSVSCPSLITHGTWDLVVPVSNSRYAAREIPRARLELVRRGHHYAFYVPRGGQRRGTLDFLASCCSQSD